MRRFLAALFLCALMSAPASAGLASRAESYIGQTAGQLGLPRSLWCADFMNMLLDRRGADRHALSYARYGSPASHGCTDCIAVIAPGRKGGRWHVGVVKAYDPNGNPVIVSGNHGKHVGEGVYPRSRVKTYRNP